MEEPIPFFIGHHDAKRKLPVTLEVIQQAQSCNYDMLTCPITTPYFHSRVLSLLSSSVRSPLGDEEITSSRNASPLVLSSLNPEDTPLTPGDSINQIIATTSTWIDLSSPDPIIADISQQVLRLELTYAAFCGISSVVIAGPSQRSGCDVNQFARAVLEGLNQNPYLQIYIWLSMTDDYSHHVDEMGDLASFATTQGRTNQQQANQRLFGMWEAWNTIRTMCKYSTRLCIALSLPQHFPSEVVQSRWYSEPVRILTLGQESFSKNAKGYPVLSRSHQAFILRMAKLKPNPWIILCNLDSLSTSDSNGAFPTLAEAATMYTQKDPRPHLLYMRHLQTKTAAQSPVERFSAGYQDYLQAPLQPLTVNLESITYEVFEKDPIKYAWYERAVARALHDWIEQGKPTSNPDGRVVVAVVGAGRGPLVRGALRASEEVGVDIDMWALEKNPNAFVLLQRHNKNLWQNQVNLVKSDMRRWAGPVSSTNPLKVTRTFNVDVEDNVHHMAKPPTSESDNASSTNIVRGSDGLSDGTDEQVYPYKIDILISELLGSFADNELSPECLDGVQHLLNPIHGISIPRSYTACLTPIAAPKLHADISLNMMSVTPEAAEIPYVVLLNAIDFLSTTQVQAAAPDAGSTISNDSNLRKPIVKDVWSFHHPNTLLPRLEQNIGRFSNAHNARYVRLSFPITNEAACHGLGGYFEAVLYPGVELSTNPNTKDHKSEEMISWFPIYFPLKTPLFIPANSEVDVSMWRRTDDRKVWYEWIVDVYAFHAGTSNNKTRVGGSELHSSEKEACLM